jgi:hypothetical protein
MSMPFAQYHASGPTVARFHASDAFIRAIMGPVGSGKTGGELMDRLYIAAKQEPNPRDGVRRTKHAIVRDTYRNLEKTTIPSWHGWVPPSMGHWVGGSGGVPAVHTLEFKMPDQTTVHTIMEFVGLGDNKIEVVLPGWEGTTAYLNEIDKLSEDVITYLRGRVGRYPKVDAAVGFKGATRPGIDADFNAPDTDHWLYDMLVENPMTLEGAKALGIDLGGRAPLEFFVQPPAMIRTPDGRYSINPKAENLANLPPGYYERQILGQPDWYIRRMILNQWGASRDGEPVFPEYDDAVHLANYDLRPVPGLPLLLGADAGLQGAILICQRLPTGTWLILDEIIAPETGMGAVRMGELLNRVLGEDYRDWVHMRPRYNVAISVEQLRVRDLPIRGWGDPAGAARSQEDDDKSWMKTLSAVTHIPWQPAPTNNLTPRLEVVRGGLVRKDGILVSRRCRVLRHGFNSGYRIKRIEKGGSHHYANVPEKNRYSAPHDALQYVMLGAGEYLHVLGRAERGRERRRELRVADGAAEDHWE